jgi:hypothetical protein
MILTAFYKENASLPWRWTVFAPHDYMVLVSIYLRWCIFYFKVTMQVIPLRVS